MVGDHRRILSLTIENTETCPAKIRQVENPGPEDVAVIKKVLDAGGPRILHSRTWEDKLGQVEAWPAGERPLLDALHLSLIYAGKELVRVLGLTATRLELEVNVSQ